MSKPEFKPGDVIINRKERKRYSVLTAPSFFCKLYTLIDADCALIETQLNKDWVLATNLSGSTKQCQRCGSYKLMKLISQNKKICYDCRAELSWNLDAGQKPLF